MKNQTSPSMHEEVQTFSFPLSLPIHELRAQCEGLTFGELAFLSVFTKWTSPDGFGKRSSMETAS